MGENNPTSACNLRCEGCWAGTQTKHDTLSFELLDRILTEAKELGIYWFVISGGEPFTYPHLFELAGKHNDTSAGQWNFWNTFPWHNAPFSSRLNVSTTEDDLHY